MQGVRRGGEIEGEGEDALRVKEVEELWGRDRIEEWVLVKEGIEEKQKGRSWMMACVEERWRKVREEKGSRRRKKMMRDQREKECKTLRD